LYRTDKPWTTDDGAIAQKMNSYWANFAKTANPNLGGSYPASLGNLTYFPKTTSARNVTFRVGNGFDEKPIAQPAQTKLIEESFAAQVPY
jgi:carboxylesterase 2